MNETNGKHTLKQKDDNALPEAVDEVDGRAVLGHVSPNGQAIDIRVDDDDLLERVIILYDNDLVLGLHHLFLQQLVATLEDLLLQLMPLALDLFVFFLDVAFTVLGRIPM
jgi:hypothetical protein